jgi:glycosyltransferase involved in cell wall biosynthesis
MPVDSRNFFPDRQKTVIGRVGFVGRFKDPRKNIGMLLDAVSLCNKGGVHVTAELVGHELDAYNAGRLAALGIEKQVTVTPYVPHSRLTSKIQEFDLFVIPSFQEGLCIAGLEAMACGCPVISTRCGGPEEFVIDDQTGYLVDFDAQQLAGSISRVVIDRQLRERLSDNAVAKVREEYSPEIEKSKFWEQFHKTF